MLNESGDSVTRLSHPAFDAAGLIVEAECAAEDPRLARALAVIVEAHAVAPFVGVVTLGEGITGVVVTVTAPIADGVE